MQPGGKYLQGANLVMEVVSADDGSHKRDYLSKKADYAGLRIPEYWILGPQMARITVLVLRGSEYRVHGEFAPGQDATSISLSGFVVAVTDVLAAGKKALS